MERETTFLEQVVIFETSIMLCKNVTIAKYFMKLFQATQRLQATNQISIIYENINTDYSAVPTHNSNHSVWMFPYLTKSVPFTTYSMYRLSL